MHHFTHQSTTSRTNTPPHASMYHLTHYCTSSRANACTSSRTNAPAHAPMHHLPHQCTVSRFQPHRYWLDAYTHVGMMCSCVGGQVCTCMWAFCARVGGRACAVWMMSVGGTHVRRFGCVSGESRHVWAYARASGNIGCGRGREHRRPSPWRSVLFRSDPITIAPKCAAVNRSDPVPTNGSKTSIAGRACRSTRRVRV
jgi:hypothetical protein